MGALEVIAVIAFVVELTGLDAIKFIKFAALLLRIPQCAAQCAKLEDCTRMLRTLLEWPEPTGRDLLLVMIDGTRIEAVVNNTATQPRAMAPECIAKVVGIDNAEKVLTKADVTLAKADRLVDSYRRSTLWCLIQTSRRMEVHLCDMQTEVDTLCLLVRGMRDNLYTVTVRPSDRCTVTVHPDTTVICVPSNSTESSDCGSYNGTDEGGEGNESDNTEPGIAL